MTLAEFESALLLDAPPDGLPAPLAALWWGPHQSHAIVKAVAAARSLPFYVVKR